jgi:hypothetical protein
LYGLVDSKISETTDKVSIKKIIPKKLPNGKYFKESFDHSVSFISIIITTNKTKTAIAPQYIIINLNEMYSHSNKNNILPEETKLNTNNKTE